MEKKKTVLVIEDEKNLREALVDVLSHRKLSTLQAKNGKEGLEMALSKHPEIILLDLIMPEMDGMEVLKKIRSDSWGANVPVIILTNVSATTEQLVNSMVAHKPANYLIKSDWKIHDVISKVEEVLESQ